MNPKFYIDQQGIVKYIADCPEEPQVCMAYVIKSCLYTACTCDPLQKQYERDLQAAKDSAVPFVAGSICKIGGLNNAKPDSLHPLPDNYRVEVKEVKTGGRSVKDANGIPYDYHTYFEKLAYILPTKEPMKESCTYPHCNCVNCDCDDVKADEESGMYEDGCACGWCGKKYKVDFMIPDELWEKISSHNLLCGHCIIDRIERLNQFGAFQLTDLGDTAGPVIEGQEELTVADIKQFIDRELGGYKVVHIGHAHKVIDRQFIYESDVTSLALELLQAFKITRRDSGKD